MDSENKKIDVIVVGAGPSGVAAAITLSRAGKKVVVLERAENFGSKNMFGGAVYLKSLKSILPNSFKEAPFERFISNHTFSLLSDDGAFDIKGGFLKGGAENAAAATVLRPKFDAWFAQEAKKEGVFFAPRTLVKNLILKDGAVIGVETEIEKYYAPIVILADGVNSILAKQIGLRKDFFPRDMFLSVKETYKMDKSLIEQRFHLSADEGAAVQFLGGLTGLDEKGRVPFAMGFLYTFKDSISIGLGVSLEDLAELKIKPYELLDKLKAHPSVKKLIEGGEFLEYSAHMIPEFGYKGLPKLYANGVLIAGDAAGFVNGAHFEGTNFAIESGKLAGEAAAIALDNNDAGEQGLKIYRDKLKQSFILKDLKAYRNVIETVYSRKNSLLKYYPKKALEFLELLTCADNVSKRRKIWKFILSLFTERSILELFRDCLAVLKLVFEVLF